MGDIYTLTYQVEILLFLDLIGTSFTPSGTYYYFYGEEFNPDANEGGAPWEIGTHTAVLDLSKINKSLTYYFGAACANACYYYDSDHNQNYHNSVTITEVWLE